MDNDFIASCAEVCLWDCGRMSVETVYPGILCLSLVLFVNFLIIQSLILSVIVNRS
jgi:hypothetical protein